VKVAQLIEHLQKLPQDKSIMCQVIPAQGGGAWNMHFDFHDVPDSWMVQLAVHHRELVTLPPLSAPAQPQSGILAVLNRAVNQARGISRDHPGSLVLAAHLASIEGVRDIAGDLIVTHAELLRRVDERCNGRAQGHSPLVSACNASRMVLARVEGFVPTPSNGEPACA